MFRPTRLPGWTSAASLLVAIGFLTQPSGAAGRGSIVARERASGATSILVSAEELPPSTRNISEILATLPSDRRLTAGSMPPGWQMSQQGRQVRLWGDGTRFPRARLDLPDNRLRDYVGRDATIQFGAGGQLDPRVKLTIGSLPKVTTTPDLHGLITLPPHGTADHLYFAGVSPSHRAGTWEVAGPNGTTPFVRLEDVQDIEVLKQPSSPLYGAANTDGLINVITRSGPKPLVTVFRDWGPAARIRYTDEYGELTVDGPFDVQSVPYPTGPRTLTGGSALTFAGQAACVHGHFPGLGDPYGMLFDGSTEMEVWGASPTSVMLGVPADATPGPHTIGPADGSSSITIGVLTVEASLDQNRLWRGQSTTLRMRVLGTDRTFPLQLLNRSPGVVTVDGGVSQMLTTSGGAENVVTRDVRGIMRGNFEITYTVGLKGCGQ